LDIAATYGANTARPTPYKKVAMTDSRLLGILLIAIAGGGIYLHATHRLGPVWDILTEPNSAVPFWRFGLALVILLMLLTAVADSTAVLVLIILLLGAIYANKQHVPEEESFLGVISQFSMGGA
jgi:hypothetical protein